MTAPLTDVQRETLQWIALFRDAEGFSPSVRQLASGRGISVARAHQLITLLVKRGFLTRAPGAMRTLVVHHGVRKCPTCGACSTFPLAPARADL